MLGTRELLEILEEGFWRSSGVYLAVPGPLYIVPGSSFYCSSKASGAAHIGQISRLLLRKLFYDCKMRGTRLP